MSLKTSGLLALCVGMPAFLWLMVTCVAAQAAVLPLYYLGMQKAYYELTRKIFAVGHIPLIYLFEYSGSKVWLHGKDLDKDVLQRVGHEQSIMMVNHRGDLDWLVNLLIVHNGGGLGATKALIKSSLFVVPFIGFLWWASDFIGLSRNWKSDESKLKRSYALQHMYHAMGVPYVLKVFPEGTRFSQKKLEDSQVFRQIAGLAGAEALAVPTHEGHLERLEWVEAGLRLRCHTGFRRR